MNFDEVKGNSLRMKAPLETNTVAAVILSSVFDSLSYSNVFHRSPFFSGAIKMKSNHRFRNVDKLSVVHVKNHCTAKQIYIRKSWPKCDAIKMKCKLNEAMDQKWATTPAAAFKCWLLIVWQRVNNTTNEWYLHRNGKCEWTQINVLDKRANVTSVVVTFRFDSKIIHFSENK